MKNMHPDDIIRLDKTTHLSEELEKLMVVAALRFVYNSEFYPSRTKTYSDVLDKLEIALAALIGLRKAHDHRVCVLRAAAAIVEGDNI